MFKGDYKRLSQYSINFNELTRTDKKITVSEEVIEDKNIRLFLYL